MGNCWVCNEPLPEAKEACCLNLGGHFCSENPPSKAIWLDAPTCEGWWWADNAGELQVVRVVNEHFFGEDAPRMVAYVTGDDGWDLIKNFRRWYGPLMPPEG